MSFNSEIRNPKSEFRIGFTMPESLRNILNQIKSLWNSLPKGRRVVIGLTAVLVMVGLIFLIVRSSRPEFLLLYSNLEPSDASMIENELSVAKVQYKLAGGGTSILVPKDEVYQTRINLANKGLPQVGGVGFEIFDKTDFGATDFVQRLKYRRGLQGELQRSITSVKEIVSAKVLLAIPEPSLFYEQEELTKASVVLNLQPGRKLSKAQVDGIVHLIASSVEGLAPDNITIIDTLGKVLSRDEGGDTVNSLTQSQMDYQHAIERRYEEKVQGMLEKVLGPNTASVRVAVDLDLDSVETTEEIYDPDKSVILTEQQTEQSSTGGPGVIGIPGVASNISLGGVTSAAGSVNYKKLETTINYEVSKTIQHKVQKPGEVKRLSVAVIVDDKVDKAANARKLWTQPELQELEKIVMNAVGYSSQRGDEVQVKNISFDTSMLDEEKVALKALEKEELYKTLKNAAIWGAIIIASLIMLLFIFRSSASHRQRGQIIDITERAIPPPTGATLPSPEEKEEAKAMPLTPPQKKEGEEAKILAFAKDNAQITAQLIRSWLVESENIE